MIASFDKLSANSRIWIYQSDRPITAEEQIQIRNKSAVFLKSWAAHGQDLLASAEVIDDYFLIISTDESFNMASGCSIDTSFRFIQELGSSFQIDFFNRANLAFSIQGKVELIDMKTLKEKIEQGNIQASSLFYNNSIRTLGELRDNWRVKAEESWLKRYFKAAESV